MFSEEKGLRHWANAFFSFQTDFFHFKWTQPTAVCVFFISNGLISFQMDPADCGVGLFHFKWTYLPMVDSR